MLHLRPGRFLPSALLVALSVFGFGALAGPSGPVTWGSTVNVAGGGWGRMVSLDNGTWLAVSTLYPAGTNSYLAIYRSTDTCRSWTRISQVNEDGRTLDNGELVVLSDGAVLLTMRSLIDGVSYRLPVYRSADDGQSWSYLSTIDTSEGLGTLGLWEPDFQVLGDGRLVVTYSNEKHGGYSQLISERVSGDGGATWGAEIQAVAQPGGGSLRPGMSQMARMANGQYILVYEIVGLGNADVYCKFSSDGVTWPADLGARIPCQHCGPFVTALADGRVFVTSCENQVSFSEDFGQSWQKIDPPAWNLGFNFSWPAVYGIGTNELGVMAVSPSVKLRFGTLRPPAAWPASFVESFDSGTDTNWTRYGGNFAFSNGRYLLNNTNTYGKALTGDGFWADGTLEADVLVGTPGNAGLMFRVTNPDYTGPDAAFGYYVGLDTGGSVVLGRMENSWRPLTNAPMSVVTNTWHHMKITLQSSAVRIYVDDLAQPKITWTDNTFWRGQVGVRAYQCNARFDNIAFTRADSITTVTNLQAGSRGTLYPGNRAPLQPSPMMRLPAGSIEPMGWLLTMLQTQRSGMNGRLEEISPWLKFSTSDWTAPNGAGATQGWERVPYWLRGYIDMGYCLGDDAVISNATRWVQGVMTSQRTNGYFGPASLYAITGDASFNGAPDLWPAMPMLDAMRSYYEYSGDAGALELMRRYCQWENSLPAANFGAGYWPKMRMGDNIESVYWLYNRVGDSWLLDLAGKMYTNMARWDSAGTLPNWHNVNIAEGFRTPTVYWQQSGGATNLQFAEANYQVVMGQYGQVPGGAFGADENCRTGYRDPRQGFETCGWVEFMRSCEILGRITGNPVWAERCEDIAVNSFPASLRTNQLSLHYLTAPNQVQLDRFNKAPDVQNGGTMFSYSPFEVYHCCQHNHGQGWPYFCEETWVATWDNGLCASLYAPVTVRARVGNGSTVSISETTDYPFGDTVRLSLATAGSVVFPLYLRVPQWCSNGWVEVNGQVAASNLTPRSYLRIQRSWADGDQVTLHLPRAVTLRTWAANNNAVSVNYGPLTFSLLIGERWLSYGGNPAWPEWEAYPTTPWNYGLVLDPANPAASFTVLPNPPGPMPAYPFSLETVPIFLQAKARRIPEWRLDSLNAISPLQPSPAYSIEPIETVTLVPMGAARLRVSAIPTVSTNGLASTQWGVPYIASASWTNGSDTVLALCDGLLPASSADLTIPRFTWWNHLGSVEWVRADFNSTSRVSQVSVYWFDDTGFGQCRVPQSWSVEYLSGTNWVQASGAGVYGVSRDAWNTVQFDPVETTAVRLRVQLQSGFSGGILEWRVPTEAAASVMAHYPLDGNVNDVAGGRDGVLNGGLYVADRNGVAGKALQFNGSSDFAVIPRAVQWDWTIAFRVKTGDTGGTGQWYNGKGLVDGEVGGAVNDFGISLTGSRAAFGVGNSDTTIASTSTINDGGWHHIAATRNGASGQMQLYVDGVLSGAAVGPTGAKSAPSNLRFGSLQTGVAGGFLSGVLDDVFIYDRVFAPWEIALMVGSAPLRFESCRQSGASLVLGGFGGSPGGVFYLSSSTNLALAPGSWTRVATNLFGSDGAFNLTVPPSPQLQQQFYRIELP